MNPENLVTYPTQFLEPVAPTNSFEQFNISAVLLKAISALGFTQPTPVQEKTIPLALSNTDNTWQDLMVSSKTGSGKTVAFLLPILDKLLKNLAQPSDKKTAPKSKGKQKIYAAKPRALVLCPTRELAQQVNQDAINLLKFSRGVRVASIIGGMSYGKQLAQLQNADLVIATPGRLLDLYRSGQIILTDIQYLTLDEADRMLDLGFSESLAEIEQLCSNRQQTLMFSATFAHNIQNLAAKLMQNPIRVELAHQQDKHENIEQFLFWADNSKHKHKLLRSWLSNKDVVQAIVFASTKAECDDLANTLKAEGVSAQALHGDLKQFIRTKRINALKKGEIKFLIATDVAARGIDVPTISHVFNYGLPMKPEDYTHRIGRTGRAGRNGLAITFAEFGDRYKIFDIERFTQQVIKSQTIDGLEPKDKFPADGTSLIPRAKSANSRNGAGRKSSNRGGNSRNAVGKNASTKAKSFTKSRDGNRGNSEQAKTGYAQKASFRARNSAATANRTERKEQPRSSKPSLAKKSKDYRGNRSALML